MTIGLVDSTVIIHVFRKNSAARAWMNAQSVRLSVTPITWLECATKLRDGMRGNLLWVCQEPSEPLGLSETGRSALVSSMPLKGTGEDKVGIQDAGLD